MHVILGVDVGQRQEPSGFCVAEYQERPSFDRHTEIGTVKIRLGIDIGQKRDPTAICVAEAEDRTAEGHREVHFAVRHLERLALGTPYPRVVERVRAIALAASKRSGTSPYIYVDATGVGKPVVDALASGQILGQIFEVYFTCGDRRAENDRHVTLGKAYLVSRLQMLLQFHRLHLPNTQEAQVLATELLNYEIRIDENANEKSGAFKVGTHDDLVTALGLAAQVDDIGGGAYAWIARRRRRSSRVESLCWR